MQEERYGTRDRTYSAWHRRKSTMRFVGIEKAQLLAMIDLDASLYVEYDDGTKEPLALIETAEDVGQPYKTATVTANLAKKANIPAYALLYKISDEKLKCDNNFNDIEMFRVKRLHPKPEKDWRTVTPNEWCNALIEIRDYVASKIDYENNNKKQE